MLGNNLLIHKCHSVIHKHTWQTLGGITGRDPSHLRESSGEKGFGQRVPTQPQEAKNSVEGSSGQSTPVGSWPS